MSPRHLLSLVLLLGSPALLQAASTHRCGNQLVSLDDSSHEVHSKCGEPNSRDPLGYRDRRDDYGFLHEVAVEEWSYGPYNGMYYFLRFEGNRLVRISSRRGR